MYLALKDIQKNHPTLPEPLVVMVVGAGRGPLVRSSLRYSLHPVLNTLHATYYILPTA